MKIRKPFWGVLIVLAVAVVGILWSRSDVFYRVVYLCGGLIILSWLWTKISLNGISLRRSSRGTKQQLGQVFEEQFEINNRIPFTRVWMEVEDGTHLPGSGGNRVLSMIRGKTVRNYSSYTLLSKRGQFALSPTKLFAGDPFGLFTSMKEISSNNSVIVLPYLYKLPSMKGPTGMMAGGRFLRRKTPESSPPRVSDVREYAPGDSYNRIHWPTTARRDRLMVKEFEQDPESDVWLFLDAHESVHFSDDSVNNAHLDSIPLWWLQKNVYELSKDSFEYATAICGTIANYYVKKDQIVGFVCSGQKRIILPADKGERQLSKILETLAFINPSGRFPISGLIESHVKFIQRGSSVIIVTPSTHQSLIKAVSTLLRYHMSPMVILISTDTFGGQENNHYLYSALKALNIPTIRIDYGDSVENKLQSAVNIKEELIR